MYSGIKWSGIDRSIVKYNRREMKRLEWNRIKQNEDNIFIHIEKIVKKKLE
jgi:hypothetical protein